MYTKSHIYRWCFPNVSSSSFYYVSAPVSEKMPSTPKIMALWLTTYPLWLETQRCQSAFWPPRNFMWPKGKLPDVYPADGGRSDLSNVKITSSCPLVTISPASLAASGWTQLKLMPINPPVTHTAVSFWDLDHDPPLPGWGIFSDLNTPGQSWLFLPLCFQQPPHDAQQGQPVTVSFL